MRQSLSVRNVAAFMGGAFLVVGVILIDQGYVPVALFLLSIFAAVFWVVDHFRGQRHRKAYAAFAKLHGWEFSQRTFAYNSRFVSAPFGEGEKPRQTDVLRGNFSGLDCATFTHRYELKSDNEGKHGEFLFQVTLVELPVTLPRLELIPESMAQRVAKTFGAQDIDFESAAFNRRWRVRANDRKYAYDLLDPRMLERLIQPDAEGAMIRIEGGAIMTWQAGRVGLDGLAGRLSVLTAIARRIPDHVVREYTERGFASQRGTYAPDYPTRRPLTGPDWATTPGALTSGRYTGIGFEGDDGDAPVPDAR